ncbi:hypothetical protein R1flu_002240 [Riccia fluitans]|uniref:Uncharacterized protein n=1 Tax=Riccia fluitans TaxID=41844 RepID=A0ABD1Y5K8_9MARC
MPKQLMKANRRTRHNDNDVANKEAMRTEPRVQKRDVAEAPSNGDTRCWDEDGHTNKTLAGAILAETNKRGQKPKRTKTRSSQRGKISSKTTPSDNEQKLTRCRPSES